MKKVEVIIDPGKLEKLRKALQEIGYPGMMVIDLEGHGVEHGIIQQWRGAKYKVELFPKKKVEIVVEDKDLKRILDKIYKTLKIRSKGAGKIFVYDVIDAVRIRTGEKGNKAIR